jgi:hypothetical protein
MLATGMGKGVSIRWRRSLASPFGPKSWSLTQTLLAKLRIENWLTFLIWLQSKLTRSQATGAKTSDERPKLAQRAIGSISPGVNGLIN